ncbi:hypothetical protein FHS04_002804 [Mesoflavibacter sabulilitoris]|nr:hypothetical protein [Mesoflavibacter zeaxanthinifaciens]MBB3125260.1 hypothetical protein [Mesoflavibacter zeaxanthinifaciens subsp. sabulilitoris]
MDSKTEVIESFENISQNISENNPGKNTNDYVISFKIENEDFFNKNFTTSIFNIQFIKNQFISLIENKKIEYSLSPKLIKSYDK